MKNTIINIVGAAMAAMALVSCSNKYLNNVNTDATKPTTVDPNTQLTTGLLQSYGDFQMMDTYRCYITGFTQHLAGGWNVSNYAGSVYPDNDMMRAAWDQLYSVGIKNLVDAINRTKDKPNLNAALRIQRVYLISILTDIYGDVPCSEAGLGDIEKLTTPKYDTQEEIYDWFFKELEACVLQLNNPDSKDVITGDVTAYGGNTKQWMKYANSLRLRFAMRISDVKPEKAAEEFEAALAAPGGVIDAAGDNTYVRYYDGPFTLYDGAREHDLRVNALGEMLYGQDPTSPSFVCDTFFSMMKKDNDPRLYRICRHYLNAKRSQIKADDEWNVDLTDEVRDFEESEEGDLGDDKSYAPVVGAAWWHNWVSAPAHGKLPTYDELCERYPKAKFDDPNTNFAARMMRPFLSIQLEKGDCPGVIITSAEIHFLKAEAILKGWDVDGSAENHYQAGIIDAMEMLNSYYNIPQITNDEIVAYVIAHPLSDEFEKAKEQINTQAWILHLMNPSEAWANLRRSDYPVLVDREKLPIYPDDFTYGDNLKTPVRLMYPALEAKYNKANYEAAIQRLGGSDDWHKNLWWDLYDIHVK